MGLLFVCVLTFASLIYFAERDSTSKWSFLESFWWGLMVLTTVGIGDKSPHSATGQVGFSLGYLAQQILIKNAPKKYVCVTKLNLRQKQLFKGGTFDSFRAKS